MKVNSPESLKTGQRLMSAHRSWSDVREKSHVTPAGVFVVDLDVAAVDAALERLKGKKSA